MRMPALNPDIHRSHDLRNMLHTWILIGGSAILMALIAWSIYGLVGLVWAAFLGAFGLWSVSRMSPKVVLGLYKARPLTPMNCQSSSTLSVNSPSAPICQAFLNSTMCRAAC
jgi:heat shock protein HtpX